MRGIAGAGCGFGAIAVGLATGAVAQPVGTPPATALEEIVVTAQRREQRPQVPLTVSAITGDTAERSGSRTPIRPSRPLEGWN